MANQFSRFSIGQPDRTPGDLQQLAHLFKDDGQHLVQVKAGAYGLNGPADQPQLNAPLSERLDIFQKPSLPFSCGVFIDRGAFRV